MFNRIKSDPFFQMLNRNKSFLLFHAKNLRFKYDLKDGNQTRLFSDINHIFR